jgi:hypothetical protein
MSASAPADRRTKQVSIVHNGEAKRFPYHKDDLVGRLREQALAAFGIVNGPHLFGLFRLDGTELEDARTLHQMKVKAGDELVLRQSIVRGGLLSRPAWASNGTPSQPCTAVALSAASALSS